MKESKFKGRIERCEIESLVNPLKDREPTDKWRQELKALFKHLHFSLDQLYTLASSTPKGNDLNHRYTTTTMQNILQRYRRDGTFTDTSRRAINDHLDLLIKYFAKPDEIKVSAQPTKTESWAEMGNRLAQEAAKEEARKASMKTAKKVRLTKIHIHRMSNDGSWSRMWEVRKQSD